ncbi:UNVERIFIED_CONTAM: hypothetical protein NCL1_19136 [Trichonephila clavipes]
MNHIKDKVGFKSVTKPTKKKGSKMYEEDPDDCIFVTENKGDGTSSALSLGQLNGDPNENVHIVYENVKPYPEVLIVKEVPIIRISDMEANPVAESTVSEPIASISSIPPVNEKDQNKTKTSEATGWFLLIG